MAKPNREEVIEKFTEFLSQDMTSLECRDLTFYERIRLYTGALEALESQQKEIACLQDQVSTLRKLFLIARKQESLGAEFEDVLNSNRWQLYD